MVDDFSDRGEQSEHLKAELHSIQFHFRKIALDKENVLMLGNSESVLFPQQ